VLIASHGSGALAAARVGSQIESLTWLIVAGFASALTAFVGQNFGAGKWGRIHKGFKISSLLMLGWGLAVTLLLFFGGTVLLGIFIPDDPEVVAIGVIYLKILATIQIAACLEGAAAGAFRGLGKTMYPSVSSIASNVLRVMFAYAFTYFTNLGLNGLWIAISLSAGIRGMWIYIWYVLYARRRPRG
jgi:Na+-driven multidrug efflux pump